MCDSTSDDAGCDSAGSEAAASDTDAHGGTAAKQGTVVERLSRYGMQVVPSAFLRRSRLQRQREVPDGSAQQSEAPERGSLTPAMRKRYLQELLFGSASNSGFSSALSAPAGSASPEQDAGWALCPMEHAWMLSAVEGNYATVLEFISEDPHLLTRRDFISGYSVLHWLAKRGQDEGLLKVLRYAEAAGTPVNVNLRGSGGYTPLHVASMHAQYPVVKLLVGAFGADVDAMDYGGRRAWQYLRADAPLEMKELLGTWDDEHSAQPGAHTVHRNANNNSAGAVNAATSCDEVDHAGQADEVTFDRTERSGSWRIGSFRKMFPSLSFFGSKS